MRSKNLFLTITVFCFFTGFIHAASETLGQNANFIDKTIQSLENIEIVMAKNFTYDTFYLLDSNNIVYKVNFEDSKVIKRHVNDHRLIEIMTTCCEEKYYNHVFVPCEQNITTKTFTSSLSQADIAQYDISTNFGKYTKTNTLGKNINTEYIVPDIDGKQILFFSYNQQGATSYNWVELKDIVKLKQKPVFAFLYYDNKRSEEVLIIRYEGEKKLNFYSLSDPLLKTTMNIGKSIVLSAIAWIKYIGMGLGF